MRPFLTVITLLSAVFFGSTALAQDESAPAQKVIDPSSQHLHAKFNPPPGWHYQIGSLKRTKGVAYSIELYNPTVGARGKIEVIRVDRGLPFAVCTYYADKIEALGSVILGTGMSPDMTQCGFAWANGDDGEAGVMTGSYHEPSGGWTVAIRLFYPLDYRSEHWQDDVQTLGNSLVLEYQ